jgi:lipopolysaccharide biosynthesis glycosyltransferase
VSNKSHVGMKEIDIRCWRQRVQDSNDAMLLSFIIMVKFPLTFIAHVVDEINNAAVIHYNGNMKPWLDIAMNQYKNLWSNM